jgi:formylglycine-generating enzyme required for sulfatase activity
MSGNVREFVLDFYVSDAYSQLPDTDPVYTMDTRSRVHRGGGFSDQLENATRAAFRERGLSGARLGYLGFRCVGGEAE